MTNTTIKHETRRMVEQLPDEATQGRTLPLEEARRRLGLKLV